MKILFSASIEMLSKVNQELITTNSQINEVLYLNDLNSLDNPELIQAWVVNPCPNFKIDSSVKFYLPNLKLICTPTTGTTHIDVADLKKNNIEVIGLKGSNVVEQIKASSEFTFIHILNAIRNFSLSLDHVKNGNWRNNDFLLRGREVCESTIGIVGLGRIGGNVARWLNCMGAKIIFYDPFVENDSYQKCTFLDDLLISSDIVVLSVHLSNDTSKMINYDKFKLMKNNSWLVNTSRGEIINEEDLLLALKNNLIRGASLDVLTNENRTDFLIDNDLIEYSKFNSNLIISPHVAGLSVDSESKAQMFAFSEALKFIDNA